MAKPINAGKYRHRITIARGPGDESRTDYGNREGSGAPVAKVWAEKQDWTGREGDELGREYGEVTTRFYTRYRNNVDNTMRVICDGQTYEILAVLDMDGRRRELVLFCRKVLGYDDD
jgi:SPP1 family predicted phage head-tail adaptor